MQRFYSRSIAVLTVLGVTLVMTGRLASQDPEPVPAPKPAAWRILDPDRTMAPEFFVTNSVPTAGEAAEASKAYLVKVTKVFQGVLASCAGTSSSGSPSTWSCSVSTPPGNWPVGDARVELWVGTAMKDSVDIKFK